MVSSLREDNAGDCSWSEEVVLEIVRGLRGDFVGHCSLLEGGHCWRLFMV